METRCKRCKYSFTVGDSLGMPSSSLGCRHKNTFLNDVEAKTHLKTECPYFIERQLLLKIDNLMWVVFIALVIGLFVLIVTNGGLP